MSALGPLPWLLSSSPANSLLFDRPVQVGYHGRDVDTIIKDLLDAAMVLVKELKTAQYRSEVGPAVEAKLLLAMAGEGAHAGEACMLKLLPLRCCRDTLSVAPAFLHAYRILTYTYSSPHTCACHLQTR